MGFLASGLFAFCEDAVISFRSFLEKNVTSKSCFFEIGEIAILTVRAMLKSMVRKCRDMKALERGEDKIVFSFSRHSFIFSAIRQQRRSGGDVLRW